MNKKQLEKELKKVYQEGYDAGEADMVMSLIEIIKEHENDEPKDILGGIVLMCTKKIEKWEEKDGNNI